MSYSINSWKTLQPLSIFDGTTLNFMKYTLGNWTSLKCDITGNVVIAVNAYMPYNVIVMSLDGGTTWDWVSNAKYVADDGNGDNIGSVNFSAACTDSSGNHIYFASIRHGFYLSKNGGKLFNFKDRVDCYYQTPYQAIETQGTGTQNGGFIAANSSGSVVVMADFTASDAQTHAFFSTDYGKTFELIDEAQYQVILYKYYDDKRNGIFYRQPERAKYKYSGVATDAIGKVVGFSTRDRVITLTTNGHYNFKNISSFNAADGTTLPAGIWTGITISLSGLNIAICSADGYIYYSSDTGSTWSSCSPKIACWTGISMSGNGNVLFVCANNDHIYYTTDKGITWTMTTPNNVPSYWHAISCNQDGSKVYACVNGGNIYLGTNS